MWLSKVVSDHAIDEVIVFAAIGDEIGDRADLEAMELREFHEVRHPRHGAVIVHDLADHAGRIKPRQSRDIDGRFGMPRANQRTAMACDERKHMPRR